jgi:pepF/M3 family oligoendopeptidase
MKTWSLDALFVSVESKEYLESFKRLEGLLEETDAFLKKDSHTIFDVEKGLFLRKAFRKDSLRLGAYNNLRLATNTSDEVALVEMQKFQELGSKISPFSTAFDELVASFNLSELMEIEALKPYEFYLSRIQDNARHMLKSEEEQLLSELYSTGSGAWSRLHSVLTSTLMIPFNGQEIPLSEIRNYAHSKDAKTRKEAYEAEINGYEKIEEAIASALNAIKGEVNTLSKKRGYDSPLDQAVKNSRMTQETLDALLSAMNAHLPKFRSYLKRKAALLGHKEGLPWYDLFAPMGESSTTFTEEEAMTYIEKQFRSFSNDLADLAKKAWDDDWIDFTPRKGKRGGAFCSNLHPIKESRILTNFEGSFSNVITLAHELGHAYHGEQIFKEDMLNASYTMPVAETASTLCETIVKKAAIQDALGDEKIFLLEQSIMGSTQVIVDILSRFEFEKSVFENRLKGPLSVAKLKTLMTEAQDKAYADALDKKAMHPYMWVNKPHYYSAGLSYYNFPYAFGLLFAKGIYALYQEKGPSFVKDIDVLLQKTGQNTVEDVAALIGIDVSKEAFWHASLDVIEEEIDLFLELTKGA